LVERVPAALPKAQPVGGVQRVLRIDVVVARAIAVVRLLPARRVHPLQQGIAPELLFLLLRGIGEQEPRGSRGNSFTLRRCHLYKHPYTHYTGGAEAD